MTLVGGTLAAGGANAINMYVDRDIDALMQRTSQRPLVTGIIEPAQRPRLRPRPRGRGLRRAVVAAPTCSSAVLALAAAAFYVGVYTIWLKRTSTHNIVIGGAAGAVPVLVGWAAVTGSLAWAPIVLFVAMFCWTPPHFWALAIRYADDYRAADVPMLPAVVPLAEAARQMIGYTVGLVVVDARARPGRRPRVDLRRRPPSCSAPGSSAPPSPWRATPSPAASMRVFTYSITYVTLLFGALTSTSWCRLAGASERAPASDGKRRPAWPGNAVAGDF